MTNATGLLAALDRLPSISLTELQAEAAFLTRRDRKYLVPIEAAGALLTGIPPSTRVLEIDGRRSFGYLTPYFDDDEHSAYLGAARRRPNRFKVRTRLYTDSGVCQLEVKVRDARGRTVKHRIGHDAGSPADLSAAERRWLGSFPQVAPHANRIRHCLTTRYQRITLVLPDGAGRVTIDRYLLFALPAGRARAMPQLVVIETKSAGSPTCLDRLLWRSGHRPVAMSKFACGLSLLVPELPANRWHRLRNQLGAASHEAVAPDFEGHRLTPSFGRPLEGALASDGHDGVGPGAGVGACGTVPAGGGLEGRRAWASRLPLLVAPGSRETGPLARARRPGETSRRPL